MTPYRNMTISLEPMPQCSSRCMFVGARCLHNYGHSGNHCYTQLTYRQSLCDGMLFSIGHGTDDRQSCWSCTYCEARCYWIISRAPEEFLSPLGEKFVRRARKETGNVLCYNCMTTFTTDGKLKEPELLSSFVFSRMATEQRILPPVIEATISVLSTSLEKLKDMHADALSHQ